MGAILGSLAFVADRPIAAYTSDEGLYALQAELLASSGHWLQVAPAAPLDPQGIAETGGPGRARGQAFYVTHPLYPALLAVSRKAIGRSGYVVLSVLGAWMAAIAGALIGRHLDPRLGRPCLWVTALGSPLLFDTYTIVAHTLAAAVAGFAVLGTLVFVSREGEVSRLRRALLLVLVGGCTASCLLLRGEGLLFGLSLGIATVVAAWFLRAGRTRLLLVAGVVLVSTLVARRLEGMVIAGLIAGGRAEGLPPLVGGSGSSGLLATRFDAIRVTLVAPEFGGGARLAGLLVLGLAAALAAGALVRIRATSRSVTLAGATSAAAYGLWTVSGKAQAIPGLLVAWPFAGAVVLCANAKAMSGWRVRLLGGVVALAAAATLATETREGGGVQWGGRYLALLIPLAVPLLTFVILQLPSPQGRPLARTAVATGLVLSLLAIASLRDIHQTASVVFGSLRRCATAAGPSGSSLVSDRPLVVSPSPLVPHIGWRDYDRYQWLTPPPEALDQDLRDLRAAGVRHLVLLALGPEPTRLGGYSVGKYCRRGSLTMAVLGATP